MAGPASMPSTTAPPAATVISLVAAMGDYLHLHR
jgi:hypothetical protein